MGLEYLINISYVDDTEVFKVSCLFFNLNSPTIVKAFMYAYGLANKICYIFTCGYPALVA